MPKAASLLLGMSSRSPVKLQATKEKCSSVKIAEIWDVREPGSNSLVEDQEKRCLKLRLEFKVRKYHGIRLCFPILPAFCRLTILNKLAWLDSGSRDSLLTRLNEQLRNHDSNLGVTTADKSQSRKPPQAWKEGKKEYMLELLKVSCTLPSTLNIRCKVSLKEIMSFDNALPFTVDEPFDEFLERPTVSQNMESINPVTVETWRTLRVRSIGSQNLSMLPDMHLDILFEVLSHLHPIELVHVSRTSKTFRALLHSPSADSTWRNTSLLRDPLPECPPEISARRWVKLLFGEQICDYCGTPNTVPDYTIRRRLCTPCLDWNLQINVAGYDGAGGTPEDDDVYTETERSWATDIAEVAELYECHKAANDPAALEQFIRMRKAVVKDVEEVATTCDAWSRQILLDARYRDESNLDRLVPRVKKRLLREGWEKTDIDDAYMDICRCPQLYRIRRLGSKRWHKVRPHIFPLVSASRDVRIARERELLIKDRKVVVTVAALASLRTPIPGSKYAFYPPPLALETFPPFEVLINDPSDAPLMPDDPRLDAALADAPALVEKWCNDAEAHLASILPQPSGDRRALARATSVFVCTGPKSGPTVAIALEETRAQMHWWPSAERVEFSERGSAAARDLVLLLGLDPETATASDMDNQDARFICGGCRLPKREALSWRDCVRHAENNLHTPWLLLSPLAAADVRRREDHEYPVHEWACTLCNEQLPSFARHTNTLEHVRSEHEIDRPIEGVHLVHFLYAHRPPPWRRRIMLVEGVHPARYRCKRCATDQPNVVRLHSKRAILPHVTDKHLIESPTEDEWTEVEPIVQTSSETHVAE
ncbi:hypothetical protein C8R43DRAFT_1197867 [Mycena crocata]|nr:hypothetical protein C8R43DRAFT_1197867 [Mycena crocata]